MSEPGDFPTSYTLQEIESWPVDKLVANTIRAYEAYELYDDEDGEARLFYEGLAGECERRSVAWELAR